MSVEKSRKVWSVLGRMWSHALAPVFAVFAVGPGLALLAACSSDSHVAGNSAETGSPELAGILVFDNGQPAARTKVQCVPEGYDATTGAALPAAYSTETDKDGYYRLDSVPNGTYAIEAYHEKSGRRLLVQGVKVTEDDSVAVNDTLRAPGSAVLYVGDSIADGTSAVVTVLGTTILREATVREHKVFTDSLPVDTMNLRIYLEGDTVKYENISVKSADTVFLVQKIQEDDDCNSKLDTVCVETPLDTVSYTFMAPLALPKGVDTLTSVVTDIPIALRLAESCDSDLQRCSANGRWDVVRVSKDGTRSKKLPIKISDYDTEQETPILWVKVDSLNVTDSLEILYNAPLDTENGSAYANDIFATNRSYSLVWHFGNPLSPMNDDSEYGYFDGRVLGSVGLDAMVGGVVGGGVKLDTAGGFYVKDSAEPDDTHKVNLNFDGTGYFCFSVWVKLDALDEEQTIFEKSKEYALRYVPEKGFVVDLWVPDSSSDSIKYAWVSGTSDIKAGEWVYVAFSRHTTSQSNFYVNDRKIETEPEQVAWSGVREKVDFKVGSFTGTIDELMLGGCYRDDSWTRLAYLNQRPENYWPVVMIK